MWGRGETMATHLHTFWQCPLLDNLWKSIFTTVNKVLDDPLIAILWMKPDVINSRKRTYLLQILTAAKKAITIRWPIHTHTHTCAERLTILRNICTI